MATRPEVHPPRKHAVTYGKAVRKRPPEHLTTNPLFRAVVPTSEEQESDSIVKARETSTLPSIKKSRPASPAKVAVDIFDVPSSEDESRATPQKKRKTTPSIARRVGKTVSSGATKAQIPRQRSPAAQKPSSNPTIQARSKQPQRKLEAHQVGSSRPATVKNGPANDPQISLTNSKNISVGGHSQLSAPGVERATTAPKSQSIAGFLKPSQVIEPAIRTKTVAQNAQPLKPLPKNPLPHESPPRTQAAKPAKPITPYRTNTNHTPPAISTPAGPPSDDINDRSTSQPSTPVVLTPRGQEMWNGLLGDDEDDELIFRKRSPSHAHNPRRTGQPRKTRLTDALAQQAKHPGRALAFLVESEFDNDSQMASNGEENEEEDSSASSPESQQVDDVDMEGIEGPSLLVKQPSLLSQGAGSRVTYSRQRSMLVEVLSEKQMFEIPLHQGQPSSSSQRRGSIPVLPAIKSLDDDEDEDSGIVKGAGIRTFHELRQAGANNRFLDEMEDILDQIRDPSSPSSTKRLALLDLASKMNEKPFVDKFISLGIDQRLFIQLGNETDIISGYLTISLLLTTLYNGISSLAVTQLRRQGITSLLQRLLKIKVTIPQMCKDRKSDMSKMVRQSLLEQQMDHVNSKVWDDDRPEELSPRTTALRCLELIVRHCRESGNDTDFISLEIGSALFSILSGACSSDIEQTIPAEHVLDCRLALSILEFHALTAVSSNESVWVNEYIPIISRILQHTLSDVSDNVAILQTLVLRLALNVTTNNPKASGVLASPGLMDRMSTSIIKRFQTLSRSLIEEQRNSVLDNLVLMLGVMINLAKDGPRTCLVELPDKNQSSLQGLVIVFLDNYQRASEANSVQDSHQNVAFGYLAILLGYLSLVPSIKVQVKSHLESKSLRPLTHSIEEFIAHHKRVDDLLEDEIEEHVPESDLTDQLQAMLDLLVRQEKEL